MKYLEHLVEVSLNLHLWIDHVQDVPEEITFIEGEPGLRTLWEKESIVLFLFCRYVCMGCGFTKLS